MTIAQVYTMLTSITGFSDKVVYWAWPENKAPKLPFICYHTPDDNNFGADNAVFYAAKHFIIELYTKFKDETSEGLIEAKLTANDIYYTKQSSYLDDEKCYFTTYEIEV